MKKLLIILVLLSLPFSAIAQQWQWLYPYPTTNRVIDFYFTDKDNGFIIADNGEILKTNDGCSTWQSETMADITLIDIYCLNNNCAWILGYEYSGWSANYIILKTDDGGNVWNQYDISSYSGSYSCLYFISESKGWVAGSSGNIKMTTDGGVSWNDKSITNDINPDIFYIHFTDDQNGVVIGEDYGIVIGKTNNGGISWDLNLSGVENNFYGGYFANTNTYYAVGERGLILTTNNYGNNWSFPSNTIQKSLYSVSFSDQTTGWAVGEDSTVLKTTNGGESWELQSISFSSEFVEVKFHDNNIGWILGTQNGSHTSQTFLSTENGGQNWENKFVTFDESLYFTDVCFVDSTNGWVISDKKIYYTKDGGRTWELQYTGSTGWGSSEYLYSIFFVDSLKGFCVGGKSSNGYILKTTDGGDNWTSQSYSFGPLRDLHFISELTGWFVGDDGTILRTLNGGSTFEYLSSGVTNDIYDVYFLDDNHGWAITNAQTILRTNDGGINWSSSTFSTSYYDDGRCVFFSDTLTGFIGTTDGLFKSIDGGINWNPISLTSYDYVTDIYFANDKDGWALASYSGYNDGGIVYQTNDGGSIWNEVLTSGEDLNSFSFIPEGYAWAVGGNSTIAKYAHGGSFTPVNFIKSTLGPTSYKLYQCYPNPFNPSTTITYDLPERAFVELKIYDTLGRELKTLVNEVKDVGRHQINLNLKNYASGTYFYQIKANNFMKTKKLTLVK